MVYIDGKPLQAGTPEAAALADRIMRTLVQCACVDRGLDVPPWEEIQITKET